MIYFIVGLIVLSELCLPVNAMR